MDHFLSWSAIIKKIHRTISGYLALLWRIKDCLPHYARLTFHNCCIRPHLAYCSTIWANATASGTIKLHRLQKRAVRTIYTDPGHVASSRPTPPIQQLRWLPLPQRIQYRQARMVYKAVHGLVPGYRHVLHVSSSVIGV